MKTSFYLNGKKTSQKNAEDLVGKAKLKLWIAEAKEQFMEDPYVENDWMTSAGIMTIAFE